MKTEPRAYSVSCTYLEKRFDISKTSSPPDKMSLWRIFQSVISLPLSVTDLTYLFSRERFFAVMVKELEF